MFVYFCSVAAIPFGNHIYKVVTHPTLPITVTAHEDRQIKFFDNKSGEFFYCHYEVLMHYCSLVWCQYDFYNFFERSLMFYIYICTVCTHGRKFHLTVGGDNKYKISHEQFLKGTQIIQSNCTYKDMSPQ